MKQQPLVFYLDCYIMSILDFIGKSAHVQGKEPNDKTVDQHTDQLFVCLLSLLICHTLTF